MPTWGQIVKLIDYANLEINTQERDIRLLCLEAEKYGIPTVVVNPGNVKLAATYTKSSHINVAAAISYPIGAYWPEEKGMEIADAIEDGADEIYMVMAVGKFLDGRITEQTIPEMAALVREARGRTTKLVTEVSVLNSEEKRRVCELAIEAGIDFLVTSTDFPQSNLPPVTLVDIHDLKKTAGNSLGIIYKGKLDSCEQVDRLLTAGVTRFCTPSICNLIAAYK